MLPGWLGNYKILSVHNETLTVSLASLQCVVAETLSVSVVLVEVGGVVVEVVLVAAPTL